MLFIEEQESRNESTERMSRHLIHENLLFYASGLFSVIAYKK